MDIRAKLLALRNATDGGDNAVSDDEGAHVLAFAFRDEFLEKDLLLAALECLDDGFRDLNFIREDDTDSLRAFEELDDDGCAANALEGTFDIAFVIDVSGGGDADIVAGKDLEGAEFIARVADASGSVWCVNIHLLELADNRSAVTGNGCADAR